MLTNTYAVIDDYDWSVIVSSCPRKASNKQNPFSLDFIEDWQ